MPIGLYDVRDREPVYHPQEIAHGLATCKAQGLDYINGPDGRAIPLATYIDRLNKRWQRAVRSGQQMDALRMGYCTIESVGSPEPSRATH